jgi:hypothetical protein
VGRQLTSINQKISLLAGALPAQLEQLGPVDPQSLIPQTIVPATINERLLMLRDSRKISWPAATIVRSP